MKYEAMFAQRGSDYDRAMQAFPKARDEEFMQLIERAGLNPGDVVADVPAGGHYLCHYLPSGCDYRPHEPCASFLHGGQAVPGAAVEKGAGRLLPLPWAAGSIDAAISLAGIHHLEDKRPLFLELKRVVKSGGCLALSDVAEGSVEASFLDDYVGAHNATGHDGLYLNDNIVDELQQCGWRVLSDERVAVHWRFSSTEAMGRFCHGLFGLNRTVPAQVASAIAERLGVRHDGPEIGMPWALRTLVAEKPCHL